MTLKIRVLAPLVAVAATVGAGTAVALNHIDEPEVGSRIERRAAGSPAEAPTGTVPSALRATFPALAEPATAPPASVRRLAAAKYVDALGLNPALTRPLQAPPGSTSDTWYLVPGVDAACLVLGESEAGAVCTSADRAASQGIAAIVMPPPAAVNGKPVRVPPSADVQRFRGIAPGGVRDLRLTGAHGATRTFSVQPNGTYDVDGQDVTQLELVDAGGHVVGRIALGR